MVELNQRDRTIKIKIVYYGPPVGGKTTNLRVLHQGAFWSRRGELISVNSAQDRTILFDFMPLKTSGFRGFDVKLQLIAVPGQAVYASSRRVALKATDGIVFVANSAIDRFQENQQSYKEMVQYLSLYQINPLTLPMVLQYNKRDLPKVLDIAGLDNALNQRRVPAIPAVASRGEGVLETFQAILLATIQDLSARFRTIEMGRGQTPQDWVAETIEGIFGKRTLAAGAPGPEPPRAAAAASEPELIVEHEDVLPKVADVADHRKVRLQLAEDFPRPPLTAAQHAKVQESLAESYAEASTELSVANAELREERDLARRQLDQVRRILGIGDELAWGTAVAASLSKALACFGEAGGTPYVSFLLAGHGGGYKGVLKPPLKEEPLLKTQKGLTLLEQFLQDDNPTLVRGDDMHEVEEVLAPCQPALAALAVVPHRTPTRLLGFALLYYTPDAALPSQSALDHLGVLARIVRSPLELAVEKGKA
jgi:signal recognition particle receptor subunit beta